MRISIKLWLSALAAAAAVASVQTVGGATAATQEPDLEGAAPGAAVSRGEGPPPILRGVVSTLSAEDRARSAKGLVDLNGNGLSDGLEDSLAGLAANALVDVIVTFSGPGNAASAQAAVGAFSVRYEYNIIDGFAATLTAGQARALATAPGVFRVQEDATVYAFMESARPDFGVEDVVAEFGLDPFEGGITGNGVTICMVDTGIQDDHEAFNVHNPDGTIASSRIAGFKDFTGDLNGVFHTLPYDYNGHGTHTAATAAGDGGPGPSEFGGDPLYGPKARGVAPGASLLIAKVLRGDGVGANSGVLAGIEWCVEQNADIISASLGIPGSSLCDDAVCLAMENAALAGVLPVVAAGNEGDLPESIGSPAASPLSLTVAAAADFSADPGDLWATSGVYLPPFSSLGPTAKGEIKPDIAAPGVTILSAWSDNYVLCDPLFGCLPEPDSYGCGIGCYNVVSGTSMATPHVSGVAALMLQVNPSLTPAQIKQIIAETAHDRLTPGKDIAYGHGLIDALAAVKQAMGYAEGSYTPNEFPSYFVGTDSVPDNGYTDIPITVTDTSLPLAVSITIDGAASCAAWFLGVCLGYSWDPDLEMDLYTSNAAGDPGVLAFSSGCPAIGDCGTAGQRETAYVAANAATTHYLVRVYGWDGDPNFGKGGTFTYEISNGVDSRDGGPAPDPDPGPGSNAVPVVEITSPADGVTIATDESIAFTGTATDFEDGDLTASLAWTSNLDGEIGTGDNFSATLSAGSHTVTASVTDSALAIGNSTISVNVVAPNAVPVVTITSPPEGETYASGDLIAFTGTASDAEDGDLKAGLVWTSNLDGLIGDGSGFSTTALRIGTHTVTASVSDSELASGRDTVNVTVEAANIAPVADAGPDQGGEALSDTLIIYLNGNGSDDPDGGPLTSYEWTLISKPRKSGLTSVDIGGANTADATFEPDKAGTYEFQLTVSDGIASSSDTMVLTVEKPPKTSGGGGCNPKSPKCTSPG